jgi:hypothetical protein
MFQALFDAPLAAATASMCRVILAIREHVADTASMCRASMCCLRVCTSIVIEKDSEGLLDTFAEKATDIVAKYVTVLVWSDEQSVLATSLQETMLGKRSAAATAGVLYLAQHAGESDTTPHYRIPRFRCEDLKMVAGAVMAPTKSESIPPGLHFIIGTGGKKGNEDAISRCFVTQEGKAIPKQKSVITLLLDEESLSARKGKQQGQVKLSQSLVVFSPPDQLWAPQSKARMHYTMTSALSDVIAGIVTPPYTETWMVSREEKSALLGTRGVIRASGGVPDEIERYERPAFSTDLIPVNWFPLPVQFYEEMIHSWGLKVLLVATVLDEAAGTAGIMTRTPVILLAFSEEHKTMLQEELRKRVWEAMRDTQSSLYEPVLCDIMGAEAAQQSNRRVSRPRGNSFGGKDKGKGKPVVPAKRGGHGLGAHGREPPRKQHKPRAEDDADDPQDVLSTEEGGDGAEEEDDDEDIEEE